MGAEWRVSCLAALTFLAGCGPAPDPVDRPNVILITLDTLRADHLGLYGYPQVSMPTVEAWGERGVVFDRVYAPMSQTLPSHSTMMTGVTPRLHGALENFYVLVDENLTLAELFIEELGYETFGAIGALVLSEESGIAQGFEHWDQPDGSWDPTATHPPERRASEVTDVALAWAKTRDEERPTFLWLHYYDPHGPFEPPESFTPTLDRALVAALVRDRADEFGSMDRSLDYREKHWWTTPAAAPFADMDPALRFVADTWWAYLTELEYTDTQLKRLFDGLEAEGMLDNAVVVIVSDHGEGLFEHGEKGHGVHIWEEMMLVPMIVARTDGARAGERVAATAVLDDLAPTMLSAAGVEPELWEGAMLGFDHWTALGAGRTAPARAVFLERPHFSMERMAKRTGTSPQHRWGILAGVVDGSEKLIRDMNGKETKVRQEVLVDLAADPAERGDVAAEQPDRLGVLGATLEAWLAAHPTELPGTQADLSEDRIRQLQDLGYMK